MTHPKSNNKQETKQGESQHSVCNSCNSNCRNADQRQLESAQNSQHNKSSQTCVDKLSGVPVIPMSYAVYRDILHSIGSHPPEMGGILLGPIGTNEVTKLFVDSGGSFSSSTYSPDHVTLNRKMKDEWLPAGIDMKGFVHSHPGRFDQLSTGDLAYIARLLDKNDDMDMFIAPIVIPQGFRMQPIVVLRENPGQQRQARLMFF